MVGSKFKRGMSLCSTFFFSFLALFRAAPVQAQEAAKPNIVVILMDNFGWGEPGFNGGGIIRGAATPRLDQLADEGIRFTILMSNHNPRHRGQR